MQNPPFIKDEIYHVYNRGVDKRDIFMDDDDRFRFIHDLYEFNDEEPAENIHYKRKSYVSYEISFRKDRKIFVEILAYVLMPNHFHLMLRPIDNTGVTNFMHKLGIGYSNYFNTKYKRCGALFQGKFKAKRLESDQQFAYLPYYMHLNPLDLSMPTWREQDLKDVARAQKALKNYRWSSHLDYSGKHNFPSVLHMDFLQDSFGGQKRYTADFEKHLELLKHEDSRFIDTHFDE